MADRPADEMDLTTLCKPFGMLHPDTQAALMEWPHGREWFQGEWIGASNGKPLMAFTYRAKPAPATIRATIPWEALQADIEWVAMDEDGEWFGYHGSVKQDDYLWCGKGASSLRALAFQQGTEHWTETLQQRPLT